MSTHLSRLFSAASGLLATRFRLLGIELQEEMERVVMLTLLVAATAVFASMFLLLATVLLLVLFWDDYRVSVAFGLTFIYGGLAVACLLALKRRLSDGPPPFAAVADEFEQDRQLLFGAPAAEEDV